MYTPAFYNVTYFTQQYLIVFYATELANKPSSLVFKRDEDEKRTSTVQRSTSGILSSLTTELGKGVVASNSYSNSPKTRGGATITKNFESLIRQPSLTNLFDYKATTTNASPLPSVRKNIQHIFVCFFVFFTSGSFYAFTETSSSHIHPALGKDT